MQDSNVSLVRKFFRSKWVWAVLALDVVVIIIIIVIAVGEAAKTAVMSFNIVPMDAIITVNGNEGYSGDGQAYEFAPGTYEVAISHPELETKTFVVELEDGYNTTIDTFLADEDFNYYQLRDNYGAFVSLAGMASAENNQTTDNDTSAEEFIGVFKRNYELYSSKLPITYRGSSGYGTSMGTHFEYDRVVINKGEDEPECIETICIYITDTSGDKEDFALGALEKLGFSMKYCQIVYRKVEYEG